MALACAGHRTLADSRAALNHHADADEAEEVCDAHAA